MHDLYWLVGANIRCTPVFQQTIGNEARLWYDLTELADVSRVSGLVPVAAAIMAARWLQVADIGAFPIMCLLVRPEISFVTHSGATGDEAIPS